MNSAPFTPEVVWWSPAPLPPGQDVSTHGVTRAASSGSHYHHRRQAARNRHCLGRADDARVTHGSAEWDRPTITARPERARPASSSYGQSTDVWSGGGVGGGRQQTAAPGRVIVLSITGSRQTCRIHAPPNPPPPMVSVFGERNMIRHCIQRADYKLPAPLIRLKLTLTVELSKRQAKYYA